MFKNRSEPLIPNVRASKRSRVDDADINTVIDEKVETGDEVFVQSDFQEQTRRGFLGFSQGQSGDRRTHVPQGVAQAGQALGRGEVHHGGEQQKGGSGRHLSWRQRLPNVTGANKDTTFAPPADLFVFNVNKEVTEEAIKTFMTDSKGLELLECEKVSHVEARTSSFRVQVRAQDYDKAMEADTWPYRVRVRPYRHFRKHQEQGGQFGVAAGGHGHVRHGGGPVQY